MEVAMVELLCEFLFAFLGGATAGGVYVWLRDPFGRTERFLERSRSPDEFLRSESEGGGAWNVDAVDAAAHRLLSDRDCWKYACKPEAVADIELLANAWLGEEVRF
jgi:hypothetical protein